MTTALNKTHQNYKTMQTIFTLFIALALVQTSFTMLKKHEDSGLQNPMRCEPKILNLWSVSKSLIGEYPADQPDTLTKKYCPTLQQSCCSGEGIEAQFKVFNTAYLELRDYFFMHNNITANLIKTGVKPKETKHTEFTCNNGNAEIVGDSDKKISEAEADTPTLYSYFLYEMTQTYEKAQNFNYTASSYYSGFICGICEPGLISHFTVDPKLTDLKDGNHYAFQYSLESFKAHVNVVYEYFIWIEGLAKTYEFFRRLPQIEGLNIETDIQGHRDKNCILKMLKDCMQVESLKSLVGSHEKCLEILEVGIDPEAVIRNLESIKNLYRDYNLYFYSHFRNEMFNKQEKIEAHPSKLLFSAHNNQAENSWTDFQYDLAEDGFSMTKHKYDEKLWFLSATRFGVAVLVSLFGMFSI